MQKEIILQTIQAILDEGGAACIRVVADCRVMLRTADFLSRARARLQAIEGFAIAMHDCFETLQRFLVDSQANQDTTIMQEARQKVVSFVQTRVNAYAASFLQVPLSPSLGRDATYSEEDQLRDKIEAQADIMFHQAMAGSGCGMRDAKKIRT